MLQALWYTCCKAAGVLCTFEIKKIKKLTLQNNWNWVTSPTQPVILTASHAQFMYCSCLRYVMCVYCWAERKVRLVMIMCLQFMAAKVKLSSNKFCFLMYWNLVCGSCFHHLYVPVYSQSIESSAVYRKLSYLVTLQVVWTCSFLPLYLVVLVISKQIVSLPHIMTLITIMVTV